MMQGNGIRDDQVTQVHGFADQRLRKADAPQDPSNRRIFLMVQYLEKKPSAQWAGGEKAEGKGDAGGEERGSKGTGKPEDAKAAEAGEKKKEYRGFGERLFRGELFPLGGPELSGISALTSTTLVSGDPSN